MGKKILIIDDDLNDLETMRLVLESKLENLRKK
jgi:hypothetical protein